MQFLAKLLLLPLAVAVQEGHLRAASSRTALNATRSVASCTCDCCLAQRAKVADNRDLSCVPRGGPAAAVTEYGSGGCEALCAKPAGPLGDSFAALGSEVDYSRFCMAACRPIGPEVNTLCGTLDEATQAVTQLGLTSSSESEKGEPLTAAEKARKLEFEAQGSEAALHLAKGAMMRAEQRAREAKQAAALAKFAYEKMDKSRDLASEAAGQAALDNVIVEARMDSAKVAAIRAGWERTQQETAQRKAIAAAAPYKTAKLNTLRVADAWDKSAGDFEMLARRFEAQAQKATESGKLLMSGLPDGAPVPEATEAKLRELDLKSKEGLQFAEAYNSKVQEAKLTAQKIRDQAPWYDQAEVAAAENAMAATLPAGVAAPAMPPLP